MPVEVLVSQTIDAPVAGAFYVATSITPTDLIKKRGILPGIVSGDGHDLPWDTVGQRRRHHLTDNSSVNEELITFEQNTRFAYKVSDFSGPFALLVREAIGEWRFEKLDADRTRIDWIYRFFPKSDLAKPVLWLIVKLAWPGYLGAALSRVKEKVEGNANLSSEAR